MTNRIDRREFSRLAAGTAAFPWALLASAADKPGPLRVGAAETKVTPQAEGTFLIGPMQPSTGIHDDLFARVLLLTFGDEPVAIATLDYLGFDFGFTSVVRGAVAKAAGVPRERVLLNCSHTHSAPLTAPWGTWEKQKDRPFHAALPARLAEIARQAKQNLKPARLRYHREPTQVGFNRRLLHEGRIVMAPNPQGAVVPWVDVLSAETLDGKPLAVLFSHAAHPVIVHATSTLISGDYPGFAVQTLKKERGTEAVYLFAQGCSGNINGFPLQGGIDAAQAAGRDLGRAVVRGLKQRDDPLGGQFQFAAAELKLPLQPPPSVERCRELIAAEKKADRKARFKDLLAIAESGQRPSLRFPLCGIALGQEFCLLALGHEPFAEYQHFAEQVSPFKRTMVWGYTNGLECYVGTKKDYELGEKGGYECSPRGAAFMFDSRLPLDPSAEALIKRAIRELFQKLQT